MTASSGRTEVEAKTSLQILANKTGILEAFLGPGLKWFGLVIHQKGEVPAVFRGNPGGSGWTEMFACPSLIRGVI